MTFVIVEPHPDDAFLSLGFHLLEIWKEERRVILTVFANSKRKKEAEEYAESIGAESVCLGLEESLMLGGSRPKTVPELREALEEYRKPDNTIIFPLGLQHPDHIGVAATGERGDLRYLDTPYQSKLKLQDELGRKVAGRGISSLVYPPKKKWKSIPIFKSQARFFHFNSGLLESKIPETVLTGLGGNPPPL